MDILSLIRFPGGSGRSAGSSGTPAPRAPRSVLRAARFTLVELLAAMAVLSILMVVLLRFAAIANDAWTRSASNMRVYQNARAVMDLIEQDLRGIVLSNETGAEIKMIDHGGAGGNHLTFVSTVGEDSSYASELVEITYQWATGTTVLKRREVGDNVSPAIAWNFLGAPAGWDSAGSAAFETVTTGVKNFAMTVVPDAVTPKYVQVTLTLVDERAQVPNQQDQSERTFTKTIFLNQ